MIGVAVRERIIAWLAKQDRPVNADGIAEVFGCSLTTAYYAASEAVSRRKVRVVYPHMSSSKRYYLGNRT